MDFIEEGFIIDIISTPDDYYLFKEGDTFSLNVDLNLDDRFEYQWQIRDELSLFWEDIENSTYNDVTYLGFNTNNLMVMGVEFDPNQIDNIHLFYRLVISSPAYYCEDDVFTQPFEIEIYHKDLHIPSGFSPNNDLPVNIPDFLSPSLIFFKLLIEMFCVNFFSF